MTARSFDRAQELGVARLTLDEVAGLPNGYAAKLLAVPPIKHLGRVSLGPLLQTLGLKLFVTQDPHALEKIKSRLIPKSRGDTRSARIDKLADLRMQKIRSATARRGAQALNESLTPAQRIASARRASKARWKKKRERARHA